MQLSQSHPSLNRPRISLREVRPHLYLSGSASFVAVASITFRAATCDGSSCRRRVPSWNWGGRLARRAVEDGFAEAVEHPFQPGLALLRGGDSVVES